MIEGEISYEESEAAKAHAKLKAEVLVYAYTN
jgi:hypothetical protein